MMGSLKPLALIRFAASAAIVAIDGLSLCGVLGAQNVPSDLSAPLPQAPSAVRFEERDIESSSLAGGQVRQVSEPAHRLVSVRVQTTGDAKENAELFLTRAQLKVEMFQPDLWYRKARAGLPALMRQL